MYTRCKKSDVILWCDSQIDSTQSEGQPGKRRKEDTSSRRQEKEDEVEEVFEELMECHHDTYSIPQLRLWARMIVSHLHSDRVSPPNIPAFGNTRNISSGRRSQQSAFSDAITGAFAEALRKDTSQPVTPTHASTAAAGTYNLSPAKIVDLRMKNFEQLQYLQQLYDNGILS